MIEPTTFLAMLAEHGYEVVSGVPCSNISAVFHALESTKLLRYIPATTEGEAVGIASGAWLTGKKAAVICQNSGVGNMVNPLSSLNGPYRIPLTLFVSMRGAPGYPDEAQHDIMGRATGGLLELLSVTTGTLPVEAQSVQGELARIDQELARRQSCALLLKPKVIANAAARGSQAQGSGTRPVSGQSLRVEAQGPAITRREAIEIIMQVFHQALVVATTGFAYRELYASGDRPNYFYMVGSMGHAAALGLGMASHTPLPVVVLDGDGALLMKMGTCATIGRQQPANLLHIVLDNGQFESTGGQSTNAGCVDFAQIARACHYRQVWQCRGRDALAHFCQEAGSAGAGPTFAHISVSPSGLPPVARPRIDLPQLAWRFREFVTSAAGKE
jgi:phosphonopyruvate decarboxylase